MKAVPVITFALTLIFCSFSIGTPQGQSNTLYGTNAGANLTSGSYNTLIGEKAGYSLTTGERNTLLGNRAGHFLVTGNRNVSIGHQAGYYSTNGSYNIFLGHFSGRNSQGNSNTFLGYNAGYDNVNGEKNIFLGYQAGRHELGSNRLYIANGPLAENTLIYGDFSTERLGIGTTEPEARLELYESEGDSETDFFRIREHVGPLPGADIVHFVINKDGQVGIGTSGGVDVAAGYKLSVDGKVMCEELKVQLSSAWPDYVFAPSYQKASLQEVETHINENGHLPGVPSANEINQNSGIELGEMTRKQQEKIEEVFLHLIEMDKRLKALEEENSLLRKELEQSKR